MAMNQTIPHKMSTLELLFFPLCIKKFKMLDESNVTLFYFLEFRYHIIGCLDWIIFH